MSPLPPDPSPENNIVYAWALKIGGIFLTFVSGVVTATWVVATKIKGFDDRLQGVEKVQMDCPGRTLIKIDEKLDRLEKRIDEILRDNAQKH